MTNIDNPKGLKPIDSPQGNKRRQRYRVKPIAGEMHIYDPVIQDAAGSVTIAAATGQLLGSVVEFFDDEGISQCMYPGGSVTGWECIVLDDPDQMYEIQDNAAAATSALGTGAIFGVINLATGAGNDTTGLSTFELDAATLNLGGTHPTQQLKILDVSDRADNMLGYVNCDFIVSIHNHALDQGTTGAAA